jgi:transposase
MLYWSCHAATAPCHARQRQGPACRRKWSYHARRVRWELLNAFCLAATAHHASRCVGCDYGTAYAAYRRFRAAMAELAADERRRLLGELELGESYFGGRRKGKRGRGAAGKLVVFGILERAGKVLTVVVPDCRKETLKARIRAATLKGSVFFTDEFTSYNGLSRFGRHVPVNHQEGFGRGVAHINCIEGFWSFAKRLYRHTHGLDAANFPSYLAEYEFRYNHRGEDLLGLLYGRLYRTFFTHVRVP